MAGRRQVDDRQAAAGQRQGAVDVDVQPRVVRPSMHHRVPHREADLAQVALGLLAHYPRDAAHAVCSAGTIPSRAMSLLAAFAFLTILPLPGRWRLDSQHLARSTRWFPLVGICLGMLLAA